MPAFICASPPSFSFPCGSQYFREMILNDIRKARELYSGEELAAELSRIQQRLDNVECLSVDIVINLLLTYRDIQVRFFDSLLGCSDGAQRPDPPTQHRQLSAP